MTVSASEAVTVDHRRSMRRWLPRTVNLPALIMLVVLALLVLPPFFVLVRTSLMPDDLSGSAPAGLTLEHYVALATDRNLLASALNTVLFALGATAVPVFFGGVLAWIVERTDVRLKGLAYLTTIISLATPHILYVSAWLLLLGKIGPLNIFLQWLTGASGAVININSLWGMILVESLLWSPLVFLLLAATFRAANAEMEEAARISGASIFTTVWRVSLRLAKPAILAMMLFIFIRNIEAFDVPVLVGLPGRVHVLTTDIFMNMREMPPRVGEASAFSILLIVVVSVLLYYYGRLSRSAERFASVSGKGFRPRPFNLGAWRWLAEIFILLNFAIVLVLPLGGILWSSLMPFARPISIDALKLLTLKNYSAVFNESYYLTLSIRTIIVAGLAATAVMALAVVSGWLAARRRPGGTIIDQLTALPLVFPGLVLGLAVMEISLGMPFPFYGTIWVLVFAFTIRYLPYGMRYAYSGVLQIHKELEEAAGVAGASQLVVLRRVVAPLLSPAIVSGWLFTFLVATKELSMAVLLASAQSETLAVSMFAQWQNGQAGELSALGLIWTAGATVVATIAYVLLRRSGTAFQK